MAHPGHAERAGFLAGFVRPPGGIDQMLALLGVGLVASRLGGRALRALPLGFVAAMGVPVVGATALVAV